MPACLPTQPTQTHWNPLSIHVNLLYYLIKYDLTEMVNQNAFHLVFIRTHRHFASFATIAINNPRHRQGEKKIVENKRRTVKNKRKYEQSVLRGKNFLNKIYTGNGFYFLEIIGLCVNSDGNNIMNVRLGV